MTINARTWLAAGGGITVEPVPGSGPLVREHGVWIIGSGEPMTDGHTNAILRSIREERDVSNLGDVAVPAI